MTDPLDNLRQILSGTPEPEVNEFVKNQSLDKAMAEFDKKNAMNRQGISMWLRLMGAVRTVLTLNGGSMKTAYKISGGLAVATLAITFLTTTSLTKQMHDTLGQKPVVQAKINEIPASPVEAPVATTPNVEIVAPTIPSPIETNAPLTEKKSALEPQAAQLAKDQLTRRELAEVASPPLPAPSADAAMVPAPAMARAKVMALGAVNGGATAMAGGITAPGAVNEIVAGRMQSFEADKEYAPNYYHDEGRDKFEHVKDNAVKVAKEEPVSTFSIDVDTASYSFIRQSLNNGALPQKDAVRIEEMVNYFPYDYALPKDRTAPFASHVTVMPSPWNKGTKLVHIGIKGYDIDHKDKPHSNLVFLIDTSGSMNEPNKLPLLKSSLKLLLDSLEADDTISIVTYAGNAGVALEPTRVSDKQKILATIDSFNSGGSTAGAEGIRQAYDLAERNFDKHGVNRVILATDGDFNIGITDPNELKSFIERKRDTGVFLSVLGFGSGNYNDAMMQTLAQNGNGNAAYIDNLNEARKVLVQEAGSTLFTIAKDVKIQVEFNPAKVSEYRLIGYETRMLNREDFNNDKIDAGEIGAGHAVTAIYEITPTESDAKLVDDLRYGKGKEATAKADGGNEYAFLKIRYKLPKEDKSKLLTTPIDSKVEVGNLDVASTDARFSVAVAAFGQMLKGASYTQNYSYDDVVALAQSAKGKDDFGYRAEFINLVRMAKTAAGLKPLEGGQRPVPQPVPVVVPQQPMAVD